MKNKVKYIIRPDTTGAFSRRNAKYFVCFFWIVSNQVEIIYSSGRNSKETGEIIRISPRKSARGIRPIGASAAQSSEQAPLISSESLLRSWFRFSDRGFRSILVADTRDLICEKSQSTLYRKWLVYSGYSAPVSSNRVCWQGGRVGIFARGFAGINLHKNLDS
jgi:hypothetical protein